MTEVDSIVDKIISTSDEMIKSFAYEGFNPIVIRNLLKDSLSYKNDIPVLISLYLHRGTNLNKILSKTGEEGCKTIKELITRYSLKSTLGPGSTRKTMTLGRIAASYPDAVLKCVHHKPELFNSAINIDAWPGIPKCMMLPCFAAAIPTERNFVSDHLAKIHLILMEDMDRVINPKKPSTYATIKQYQDAGRNTKLLSNEARYMLLVEVEILEMGRSGKYEFTDNVEEAFTRLDLFDDVQASEVRAPTSSKRGKRTETRRRKRSSESESEPPVSDDGNYKSPAKVTKRSM